MKRKTPLRPGKPLVRKTPLRPSKGKVRRAAPRNQKRVRPVNPRRRRRLRERNFGAKADWIRTLPCLRCRRVDPTLVQPAHVHARGMGGCKGSKLDLVPLCGYPCHEEQEPMSIDRYRRRTGIDLEVEAAKLEARWQAMNRSR